MNTLLMEIISETVRVQFEIKDGQMLCLIMGYRYGSLDKLIEGSGETAELALRAAAEKWRNK